MQLKSFAAYYTISGTLWYNADMSKKKVLILTDGKAGHENQSRAFARALGLDADRVEIRFKSRLHKALSYLLDRVGADCLPLVAGPDGFPATARDGEYAAVVGTGSGTFAAVKSLARRLGVKGGVVLYPRGYRIRTFDCILAPAFDRPPKAPNTVEIPANLVANDAAFYAKGVADFRTRTDVTPEIAVILGGPNKCAALTADAMRRMLDAVFALPGAKAVTTSRRTPPDVEAVVESYPWDYRLLYSKDRFNPIPAFVSLARRLYVTAESTGMLSEACTFGTAEVVALDDLKPGPNKFRRFVDGLVAGGYAAWDSSPDAARPVGGGPARKIDLSAPFAAARALMGLEGL